MKSLLSAFNVSRQDVKWFLFGLTTAMTVGILWNTYAWYTKRTAEDPFIVYFVTILLVMYVSLFFQHLKHVRKIEKMEKQ